MMPSKNWMPGTYWTWSDRLKRCDLYIGNKIRFNVTKLVNIITNVCFVI
ncbi:hypothetical protein FHS16_006370 [Paenibacillus endophyticus]|uniref:Uncharacterized protein n=1 Tax=Paenibacillus endophyticus TaxID=1294268 RepID=A0A7W5GEA3_9BACL|nr:hypothetical protein [Paenibacillus endophyticus]